MTWLQKISQNRPLRLYHGSMKEFPNGFVLFSQNDGYVSHLRDIEVEFDKYRPRHILSRFNSMFMVDNPELIDSAGGHDDYIYLVEPIGPVFKSDLAWYTEFDAFWYEGGQDIPAEVIASNYWNGVPYINSEHSLWEYRAQSAKIIRMESQ